MKEIQLTQGKVALVDDEDFEYLSKYNWHASESSNCFYVLHSFINDKGKNENISMHRLIMSCIKGDGKVIDHIDHDGLNNQKSNLRFCTRTENNRNKKSHKCSTSKYIGVSLHSPKVKGKVYSYWKATIRIDKKNTSLGLFKDEVSAAIAYNNSSKIHFGDFANLNAI